MKRAKSSSSTTQKKMKTSSTSKGLGEKHFSLFGTSPSGDKQDGPVVKPVVENGVGRFVETLHEHRLLTAENINEFPFKKKRVRVLSTASEVREACHGGVLYWMSRDVRVQDNWALLYAQKLALKVELPLFVAFCLVPKFLNATLRHYKFLLSGLEEVERECHALDIGFRLLLGPAAERIPQFVSENDIGAVVCDFAPLRFPRQWVEDVRSGLPEDVPFIQVDAHNIVPVWVASEKQEYAARTIRAKINTKLDEYLTEFPPVVKHSFKSNLYEPTNWDEACKSLECDMSIGAVEWAKPGYVAACAQLLEFCEKRLKLFNDKRNDPMLNAISGLSPWFHFGQISVQRCVLEVRRHTSKHKASVEAFCEEAIIRRELADNFCYYNINYDNLKGLSDWAFKTLDAHRKDKRSPCYSLSEFESAKTHDDLWNAAQLQLVREGKMHGFLRMYWAKKILEWSATPEEALEFAILLNDKYSLDGRDANGYVGCMWSIGGIHDQGWAERPIFGKIRYMNYQGCKRKFDVAGFVSRYGGKIYSGKK